MAEGQKIRTLQEIVDQNLEAYDQMDGAELERMPIVYFLNKKDQGYVVTLIAPLLGDAHPTVMIEFAGEAFRQDTKIPPPDVAMVLLDTWGYPTEVLEAISKSPDPEGKLKKLRDTWSPSTHPNRVTISLCQLAFKEGWNETVQQEQGNPSTRKWARESDAQIITGPIPKAVRTLVD